MKREYDDNGFPIPTKEEWHDGVTSDDLMMYESFKKLAKLFLLVVIVIAVGIAIFIS